MKEWAVSKGATHYTHWFSAADRESQQKNMTALFLLLQTEERYHGIFG